MEHDGARAESPAPIYDLIVVLLTTTYPITSFT